MNTLTHLGTSRSLTFAQAVDHVSASAHRRLPQSLHGNLARATALVQEGAVWMEDDGGHAHVFSSHTQTWRYVNARCSCENAQLKAQEGYCKHVLATMLYKRAVQRLHQTPLHSAPSVEPPHGLPAQFVVVIRGKPYVKYTGLLALAHDRGLVSLKAHFVSVTETLALAEADATFVDGKTYAECADSTPQNVGPTVKAHFPRIALTRAKARVLRDALCVHLVAVEELAESE